LPTVSITNFIVASAIKRVASLQHSTCTSNLNTGGGEMTRILGWRYC
jgi:hypothetical protein